MPRQPGQRGQRWAHLLSGPVKAEAPDADAPHSPPAPQAHSRDALDRLDDLEQRVAALEERLGGEKPDAWHRTTDMPRRRFLTAAGSAGRIDSHQMPGRFGTGVPPVRKAHEDTR